MANTSAKLLDEICDLLDGRLEEAEEEKKEAELYEKICRLLQNRLDDETKKNEETVISNEMSEMSLTAKSVILLQ